MCIEHVLGIRVYTQMIEQKRVHYVVDTWSWVDEGSYDTIRIDKSIGKHVRFYKDQNPFVAITVYFCRFFYTVTYSVCVQSLEIKFDNVFIHYIINVHGVQDSTHVCRFIFMLLVPINRGCVLVHLNSMKSRVIIIGILLIYRWVNRHEWVCNTNLLIRTIVTK